MSGSDPDALEALLQRVQRNRQARASAAPPKPQAHAEEAAAPFTDEETDPFGESYAEEPSLEVDEGSIPPSRMPSYASEPPPAQPSSRPKPIITFPPSVPPPDEARRSSRVSAGPAEVEGAILSAPPAPHATRPVAQVVSRHPSPETLSFGQLLTRSLALRAR